MPVFLLTDELLFPDVDMGTEDGLLAVGGDLSPERLLLAYRSGIFPWFSDDEPIMWWSPPERMVLFPRELKIHRSMRPVLNSRAFKVTFDKDFATVIQNCARTPRPGQHSTWITTEMQQAYIRLHKLGHAHSVEVWLNDELVGGLYGVVVGRVFCGESMFSHVSNASKVGFITLVRELEQRGFELIDCQIYTDHLASLGAREIGREEFIGLLNLYARGHHEPGFP